jgi:hypothetical protein
LVRRLALSSTIRARSAPGSGQWAGASFIISLLPCPLLPRPRTSRLVHFYRSYCVGSVRSQRLVPLSITVLGFRHRTCTFSLHLCCLARPIPPKATAPPLVPMVLFPTPEFSAATGPQGAGPLRGNRTNRMAPSFSPLRLTLRRAFGVDLVPHLACSVTGPAGRPVWAGLSLGEFCGLWLFGPGGYSLARLS